VTRFLVTAMSAAVLAAAGITMVRAATPGGPPVPAAAPVAAPVTTPVPGPAPGVVGSPPGLLAALAQPPPAPAPAAPPALPRSIPVRLDIPAIGVHTRLMRLGLHRDGTMRVPPLRPDAPAGWYDGLVSPGEIGPAVIVGHLDSAYEGPAVFFRLGALHPGDAVSVRRTDGSTVVFTVDRVVRYAKARFPTASVYGPIDHPGLRLVTCGGSYDAARGSYRDNVVVFASLATTAAS
jgi:hypothetical protein